MPTETTIDRRQAWLELARADPVPLGDPEHPTDTLPDPARRFLDNAVPAGPTSVGGIVLDMEGEIKLGRWLPFRARQILHPTAGFVWNATVGRLPVRITGGDALFDRRASLEFRLLGLIPVARASGPDTLRSAIGRLAVEAAVWLPQALHPAAGATWRPVNDDRASVTRTIGGDAVEVTLTIGPDGRVREVVTQRWGEPPSDRLGVHPFGGTITDTGTFAGVTIATAGTVGWHHGTARQADGEFFRFRVTRAEPAVAMSAL